MPAVVMADIFKLIKDRKLVDAESPESVVRLTLRLLSNFFIFENSRAFIREHADSCIHQVHFFKNLLWGSELRASPIFEWLKVPQLLDGSGIEIPTLVPFCNSIILKLSFSLVRKRKFQLIVF